MRNQVVSKGCHACSLNDGVPFLGATSEWKPSRPAVGFVSVICDVLAANRSDDPDRYMAPSKISAILLLKCNIDGIAPSFKRSPPVAEASSAAD